MGPFPFSCQDVESFFFSSVLSRRRYEATHLNYSIFARSKIRTSGDYLFIITRGSDLIRQSSGELQLPVRVILPGFSELGAGEISFVICTCTQTIKMIWKREDICYFNDVSEIPSLNIQPINETGLSHSADYL